MTWISILCFLLLLCMAFALIIEKALQFLLKAYAFKIQIKRLFEYRNIYFFVKPELALSFFSSFKIFISSIRIKKHPEKFCFLIVIDKIHIKFQSLELNLSPSLQNKIDEVFALNLMKILDFTRKCLIFKKKWILSQKKPVKKANKMSTLLLPFQIIFKLLGYFLLSKFSIQIKKICIDVLQNSAEENKITDFLNPYDNVVNRIKLHNSSFWCQYNLEVHLLYKQ